MESPIDKLLEWYRSIPISHREDIAAIVGISLPGYETIEFTDPPSVMIDKFISITEHFKEHNFKEIAAVIAIRGYIQFFFIDKRSKKETWRENEATLKALADEKGSEKFEQMSRETRFKAEQWLVTCEKWEKLVEDHISDRHLRLLVG